MPTNSGLPDDDMDAFLTFIEDTLDLDGLPGDQRQAPPEGAPDLTHYNPALADHEAFVRDIQQAWKALHREKPGQAYWGFRLTPLELETRGVLQELILGAVLKRYPDTSSPEGVRSLVNFTMTVSWLLLEKLKEKYSPTHGEAPGHEDTPR